METKIVILDLQRSKFLKRREAKRLIDQHENFFAGAEIIHRKSLERQERQRREKDSEFVRVRQ